MCTEDYVSFEIAKLLKEKGFDAECDYLYADGKLLRAQGFACNWNNGETLFADYKNECSAPTIQRAMKWLRKAHDIYIMIDKDFATENGWHYVVVRKRDWADNIDKGLTKQESNGYTYEFACEAAIKYCLENLI